MGSEPVALDADHRGPLINVVSWVMLTFMCLSVLAKICSKFRKIHQLQGDDYLIMAATVTAICQIITTSEQVAAGLGQHKEKLSTAQINKYQKAVYAAQVLYILSLGLAKTGTLSFVNSLARVTVSHYLINGTRAFTIAWTFVAIVCIVFQCPVPHTWAILSPHCFDQPAFWNAIGSFDMAIDVMLLVVPSYIVWRLQMPRRTKVLLTGAFGTRLLMVPLTISRLVYLESASRSLDHPYFDFNTILTTEISITLSIILACFPFLKTTFNSLSPGVLTSEVPVASGRHWFDKKSSYVLHSLRRNRQKSEKATVPNRSEPWLSEDTRHHTFIGSIRRHDGSPRASSSSQRLFIKREIDFDVRSESNV